MKTPVPHRRRLLPVCLILLLLLSGAYLSLAAAFTPKYYAYRDSEPGLASRLPDAIGRYLRFELSDGGGLIAEGSLAELVLDRCGSYDLDLSLFGVVPVRQVSLSVLDGGELVVGGQSVGVILRCEGAVIVGFSGIAADGDGLLYPARDSGLQLGDSITAIDGVAVESDESAAGLIDEQGGDGEVEIEFLRNGEAQTTTVETVHCRETDSYRIGLYIRDDTGGIGTLTYYDAQSGRYGALGHSIAGVATESADGELLGRVMAARIESIHKAQKGATGEKVGAFTEGGCAGEIDTVSIYGVFGEMEQPPEHGVAGTALPARPDQVKEGAAQIVTVLEGEQPELYDIEIKDVDSRDDEGKGLTIEITDEELLQKTGGIIQGMSGSPILQEGRLVGAVTYVTVNHPERGYGCLIHKMLADGRVL